MSRNKEYNKRGKRCLSALCAPMSRAITVCWPTPVRKVPPHCLWHCSFGAFDASAAVYPSPARLTDAVLSRGDSTYDWGLHVDEQCTHDMTECHDPRRTTLVTYFPTLALDHDANTLHFPTLERTIPTHLHSSLMLALNRDAHTLDYPTVKEP